MEAHSTRRPAVWPAILISASFFLLYLCLRTNNLVGMDGALRCLEVLFAGDRFHGNNHMLYPFWVNAWSEALNLLGIRARDGIEYVHLTQAMNAFGAAAAVGFLSYLIQSVSNTVAAALGGLMFGLSQTMTLQAPSSDEPIAGLFFALLALTILAWAIRRSNDLTMVAAGFCMTAALASYQAMGTVIGPAFLMCCYWPKDPAARPLSAFRKTAVTAFGSALGLVVIYGWAYHEQGVAVSRMLNRFVTLDGGSDVYGGVELLPTKSVNAFFGFIGDLYSALPSDYAGTRALLRHSHAALWIAGAILAFAFTALMVRLAAQGWQTPPASGRRVALLVLVTIFVTTPCWYWGPNNPKMWLFPIACFSFFVAAGWARGVLPPIPHRILAACLVLCVLVEAIRDIPPMVRDHVNPTPGLAYAQQVARAIRPDDWVLADFDDITALWVGFWGYNNQSLLLPSSTVKQATAWLEKAKGVTQQGRGRLLFLSIFEHSRPEWDAFIGARVRIPYEFLDPYRKSSTLLVPANDPAYTGQLWQYTPSALSPAASR